MKRLTVLKKLLSSIMVAIIVLGQFSGYRFVSKAATITTEDGPIYLSLSKTNEKGNGYAFGMNTQGGDGKYIWSIMYSTSSTQSDAVNASNLYCIKAEYGVTWGNNETQPVKYNKNYSIPLKQNTEQTVANEVLLGKYKNELLWLIDNLYIETESDQSDLTKYLENAGIKYYDGYGYSYEPSTNHDYTNIVSTTSYPETVTTEDIIAIQQAAIWYFTNTNENEDENIYDKTGIANWLQYTTKTLLEDENAQNKFPQLSTARQEHAIVIYNYLINEAKRVAETLGDNQYKLKNTTAKLWISLSDNGTINEEQPVIEVHKLQEKPFDLSLRKAIVAVNGNKELINTRGETATRLLNDDGSIKTVDLTTLNSGTTATYEHRKDPVVVEKGDVITYAITIYNEADVAGYANKIIDQLPGTFSTGLRLDNNNEGILTSTTGNKYKVDYAASTNTITLTMTEDSPKKVLAAYDAKTGTLSSETILLDCVVMGVADQVSSKVLTNIAYIAEEYNQDYDTIITKDTIQDRDSQTWNSPEVSANNLITEDIGYTGNSSNSTDLSKNDSYYAGEQDDDDFEKIVILPRTFDLKLIKFITDINDKETENRVISVNTDKLNTIGKTTAEYILEKNPVVVKAGDFVTYTLRIYNEGHYDGYAIEISEDIPEGLEFIGIKDGVIYSWDGTKEKDITKEIQASNMHNKIVDINSNWNYAKGSKVITTKALSDELIKGFGQKNVQYADKENKIDYEEVQVIFRVKEDVEQNQIIRNEAAISEDKAVDNDGEVVDVLDRDSLPGNKEEWKKENSKETYDKEGKWPIYKEDDEDYDNIITKTFDLSLRKQIIQINDAFYTHRFSKLDVNGTYKNTLYDYYDVYSNKPKVKEGDKVVYSIRVYNEGDIDGYAALIVDALPSGLVLVDYKPGDGSINDQYGWTLLEGTKNVYKTDYLSYEKDKNRGTEESTILKAYDGEGEANYQEIYIECRVKENVTKEDSLLNVAQIAKDSDSEGKEIKDKDSIPGTSDDDENWKEEDDLDIEVLKLQEFDLALRKFITQIENGESIEQVTTRIPEIKYDSKKEQIVYTHPKDALVVHVGDTVIYTIRVYNEGDIDGYASEVKDDIPEYLEYLPEHSVNKKNEWVMYDAEGNQTEDVQKAVVIRTKYLAKGNGVEAIEGSQETNLIKAFDSNKDISEANPDYKELQVAFKVKDPNSTEYEIINFAQISEDTDSEGKPVEDKDSETDNGKEEPKEDDEDIEKVKVQYFDLSLLKFVTKVLVTENGQDRIIETGNTGDDETDIIPHVQIDKKNINKTVVKFVYTIQITNEGQIPGEATEITDYVPEGLVFVEEDNELWTDEGNNVISTKQLEGSTLEPGESAQVEVVLRWINGHDNLGPKTNIAEISEDYNEENVPDIDSIPDNKEEGEDDIDDATVLLSVKQGGGIPTLYINLTITFLSIILVGAILIKKFVL